MLPTGLRGTARLTVAESDTAASLGSGDVPVLGTPRLVALCEEASVAAIAGELPAGRTTVGTRVEIDHLAASPIGAVVGADAVLEAADGHLLHFTVSASEGGRIVGRGAVHRAVVDRAFNYLKITQCSDGGIAYSAATVRNGQGTSRPAITARNERLRSSSGEQ